MRASPQQDCDSLQLLLSDFQGAAQSPTGALPSSFRSLLSNPRLDAAMLRLLLDAFPPEVAGSDQWAAMGGDPVTAQQQTSALALLLGNSHAADLAEFAKMALSLAGPRSRRGSRFAQRRQELATSVSAVCLAGAVRSIPLEQGSAHSSIAGAGAGAARALP